MVLQIKSNSHRAAKLNKLNLPKLTPLNYDRDGVKNTSRS